MSRINEDNIPLIKIQDDLIARKNSSLYLLREDLIHPEVSGNKWRKLKYNLVEAQQQGFKTLLSFGGAYSNHIAALASAGKMYGFKTVGVIRGEQLSPLNPTLAQAQKDGMELHFVSRARYRNKHSREFHEYLHKQFGKFYAIPEGGSNVWAVKGCTEIITRLDLDYDVICTAVGTGGTMAGLVAASSQPVMGFPALKGGAGLADAIQGLVADYIHTFKQKKPVANWELITDYHFGGYAKISPQLVDFISTFYQKHGVMLDFIYTGKMLYGIYQMLEQTAVFDHQTILAVHTGGVQGNQGFEERFNIKINKN